MKGQGFIDWGEDVAFTVVGFFWVGLRDARGLVTPNEFLSIASRSSKFFAFHHESLEFSLPPSKSSVGTWWCWEEIWVTSWWLRPTLGLTIKGWVRWIEPFNFRHFFVRDVLASIQGLSWASTSSLLKDPSLTPEEAPALSSAISWASSTTSFDHTSIFNTFQAGL